MGICDDVNYNVALCRRICIHEAEGDWSVSVVVCHVLRNYPVLVKLGRRSGKGRLGRIGLVGLRQTIGLER